MSENFDPYRKWLGIPAADQPPHHYRLLGISLFEDDPDVIENAANRQMAHLRTYKTSKHAVLSQQILNELAAAKNCLLSADKKPEYDAQLKDKLDLRPAVPAGRPPAIPPPKTGIPLPPSETDAAVGTPVAVTSGYSPEEPLTISKVRRSPNARVKRKRPVSGTPIVLFMLVLGILVIAAVFLLTRPNPPRKKSEDRKNASTEKPAAPPPINSNRRQKSVPNAWPAFSRTQSPPPSDSPDLTHGKKPARQDESFSAHPATEGSPERKKKVIRDRYPDIVTTVRQSLAERDTPRARSQLAEAAKFTQDMLRRKAELERLESLLAYMEGFWDAVLAGFNKQLKREGTFTYDEHQFSALRREKREIVYQKDGKELSTAIRELPLHDAEAFAHSVLSSDEAFGTIYLATIWLLDGEGNPERAKMLYQSTLEQGRQNNYLADELGASTP